jgi:hypothetical protein
MRRLVFFLSLLPLLHALASAAETITPVCTTEHCKTSLIGQQVMMMADKISRSSVNPVVKERVSAMNHGELRELVYILEETAQSQPYHFMTNEQVRGNTVNQEYATLATVAFSLAIVCFAFAICVFAIRVYWHCRHVKK